MIRTGSPRSPLPPSTCSRLTPFAVRIAALPVVAPRVARDRPVRAGAASLLAVLPARVPWPPDGRPRAARPRSGLKWMCPRRQRESAQGCATWLLTPHAFSAGRSLRAVSPRGAGWPVEQRARAARAPGGAREGASGARRCFVSMCVSPPAGERGWWRVVGAFRC
jgi:hypothetical protein